MYLALLLAEREDRANQQEALRIGQDILRSIGEQSYYSGLALCAISSVHSAAGNLVEAEKAATDALAILRHTQSSAPLGFVALGRALLAGRRADEAVRLASEGVALVETLGGTGGSEIPLRLVLWEALTMQGSQEQAAQAQAELDRQIQLRVQQIPDPVRRASFLERVQRRSGRGLLF